MERHEASQLADSVPDDQMDKALEMLSPECGLLFAIILSHVSGLWDDQRLLALIYLTLCTRIWSKSARNCTISPYDAMYAEMLSWRNNTRYIYT